MFRNVHSYSQTQRYATPQTLVDIDQLKQEIIHLIFLYALCCTTVESGSVAPYGKWAEKVCLFVFVVCSEFLVDMEMVCVQ